MISPELVARSVERGARVAEIEVGHRARRAGRQSGARPRVIARALRELIVLRARWRTPEPAPPQPSLLTQPSQMAQSTSGGSRQ